MVCRLVYVAIVGRLYFYTLLCRAGYFNVVARIKCLTVAVRNGDHTVADRKWFLNLIGRMRCFIAVDGKRCFSFTAFKLVLVGGHNWSFFCGCNWLVLYKKCFRC